MTADRAKKRPFESHWAFRAAAWWLLATGALHMLPSLGLGSRLGLRFLPGAEILAQQWGLASLCLGLFVLRALRNPAQQPLAVDILLSYFLAQCFLLLRQRLALVDLVWFEWLGLAAALAFSGILLWLRTPHKYLESPPNLLTAQAADLPRLLHEKWASKGQEASSEPKESKEPKEPKPSKASTALPHMD